MADANTPSPSPEAAAAASENKGPVELATKLVEESIYDVMGRLARKYIEDAHPADQTSRAKVGRVDAALKALVAVRQDALGVAFRPIEKVPDELRSRVVALMDRRYNAGDADVSPRDLQDIADALESVASGPGSPRWSNIHKTVPGAHG